MADCSASSATASICSGTTTNPNTPRPELDFGHNQNHGSEGGQPDSSSSQPTRDRSVFREDKSDSFGDGDTFGGESTSSAGSRQRAHDIQPTWPQKVTTRTPALASWRSARLDNISLHLNWTPHNTSGSAFFKIQTGLEFEGGPIARRDGLASVFIFIYPERVGQLAFDIHPVEKPFGPNTVALAFQMNRAPALVLPHTYRRVSPSAEATMNSLRELTTQLSFTVYTSLPRRTLPVSWLQQLCTAITGHRLSSILACANLNRLYRGCGAQLLEGDELSEPAPNPPAYDDVTRPSPLSTTEGQKRRRRSPSDSASEHRSIRKRRRRSPSDSASEHRSIRRAEMEALLEDRLDAHKREVAELLACHRSQVLQMLHDFKAELDDKLDAREERLVEDKLSDLVAEKVEEQVAEVEERVMESITSRPLQASLTFPDHHIY